MTKKSPDIFSSSDAPIGGEDEDLRKLLTKSMKNLFEPGPCTAELVDEDDENGLVVIKRANGEIAMYMPRSVYEKFRKGEY
jgi:hypothetical protein